MDICDALHGCEALAAAEPGRRLARDSRPEPDPALKKPGSAQIRDLILPRPTQLRRSQPHIHTIANMSDRLAHLKTIFGDKADGFEKVSHPPPPPFSALGGGA